MKKLTFAGVGSAFAPLNIFQTSAVLTNEEGRHLVIDMGGDARFSLARLGVQLQDIDAVYITHLHADHIGGMEWLAFCTYFAHLPRPKLFANISLMGEMWDKSLRGGLDSIEGKVMNLTDYFDCKPVLPNRWFEWGGVSFTPVQTVHIMAGYQIVHSYGLMIAFPGTKARPGGFSIFYTGDTQFCPNQIMCFYDQADLIFQDCTTAQGAKSPVHAHFDELRTLPDKIKGRMWLMHYQTTADGGLFITENEARNQGFIGFVRRGQEFGNL